VAKRFLWIGVGVAVAAYLIWSFAGPVSSPGPVNTAVKAVVASKPLVGLAPAAGPTAVPTHVDASTILLLIGSRAHRQSTVGAYGLGLLPHESYRIEDAASSGPAATLATGVADEHGNFSGASFKIPDTWPDGERTVRVVGATSGRSSLAQLAVEPSSPGALPNVYFGKPMAKVSFQGGGFRPGEDVVVYFDSLVTTPLGTVRADSSGIVHAQNVIVPPAAPGDHAFILVGQTSSSPVRVPFSVLAFQPWLSVTDYTPQPEHPVGIVGHDFAPGEQVAVFLNAPSGEPVARGVANAKGLVTIDPAFAVPVGQHGKLLVVAVGSLSQTDVTISLAVRPYTPLASLTSYAGPPGSPIGVSGTGFSHGEAITIRLGGNEGSNPSGGVAETVKADAKGSFQLSTPLRVPDRAQAGKTPVSIVGATSQVPVSTVYAVLPITPWVVTVPAAGGAGSITIEGGGFEVGEPVAIAIGDTAGSPAATLQADGRGGIHRGGPLGIPKGVSGRVAILATGGRSGAQARAVYTIV
jgi:hypothetical protein